MKRIFVSVILVLLLLIQADAKVNILPFGGGESGGETPNQELGYTTIGGGSTASAAGRRIEITVPAGGITVSYGYYYGHDSAGSETFTMSIWNTSGVQQGGCSNSGDISDTEAWNEVTWGTPVYLAQGTYRIQYHPSNTVTYYRDSTGSNNAYGIGSCPTHYTTSSSYAATMSVANYNAH